MAGVEPLYLGDVVDDGPSGMEGEGTDTPDAIKKKIMSAVTDSESSVRFDPENKAGISNLMGIFAACAQKPMEAIEDEFAGKGYGEFKKAVADAVIDALAQVRAKYAEFSSDKSLIESALKNGSAAAQRRVNKMMSKVYRKVGFMNFE